MPRLPHCNSLTETVALSEVQGWGIPATGFWL
jgi:hypothetical protein